MDEHVEKIYCCDRGDNDNALAAAILAGGHKGGYNELLPAMMMNNGMNNPFAWIVLLALMRQNGGLFGNGDGGGSAQGLELQAQIDSLRSQLSDNQNSTLLMGAIQGNEGAIRELAGNLNCNFNTLNSAICDVRASIQQVAGQIGFSAERVINAVNMGDCNVIQAVKDCCCGTQRQIAEFQGAVQLQTCQQTGELRNGQRDLGFAITQGFAQTAFQAQQDKCDLINAGNTNTQRIIDILNSHWNDENQRKIQDLKFELSQERQNNLLLNRLGGFNNTFGCGCNTNCGCGCGY